MKSSSLPIWAVALSIALFAGVLLLEVCRIVDCPRCIRWGRSTVVYDPAGQRIIVFSGLNEKGQANDVWTLDVGRPGGQPTGGDWHPWDSCPCCRGLGKVSVLRRWRTASPTVPLSSLAPSDLRGNHGASLEALRAQAEEPRSPEPGEKR